MSQEIINIRIKDLNLWTENPRDPMDPNFTDEEIIEKAITTDKVSRNLPKMLASMGKHYDFSELPTVVLANGKYIVFDGNRRIAIIKYLQNKKIYNRFGGNLFQIKDHEEIASLLEIPCNVCDVETALDNVDRKHSNSGTRTVLERDYFLHIHRRQPKSLFLMFEEATGIISSNLKLNQRFVKDEIITESNLQSIGINIEGGRIMSVHNKEKNQAILDKLVELIEEGVLSTRTDESKGTTRITSGTLGDVISRHGKIDIKPFESGKGDIVDVSFNSTRNIPSVSAKKPRKSPQTKTPDILFGKLLQLRVGKVNSLYCAINDIYEKFKDDKVFEHKLDIIGMSLRLILDVAGREIMDSKKDSVYKVFLSKAKKEMNMSKGDKSFLNVTKGRLDEDNNLDGILGNYAHGNIPGDKGNILKYSMIVGDILSHYFSK